jgi:hypothetical protein
MPTARRQIPARIVATALAALLGAAGVLAPRAFGDAPFGDPPLILESGPTSLTSTGAARVEVRVGSMADPANRASRTDPSNPSNPADPSDPSNPADPAAAAPRADFLVKRLDSSFRRLAAGGLADPAPEFVSSGRSVVVVSPGTSLVELTARVEDGGAWRYCQALFLMFGNQAAGGSSNASGSAGASGPSDSSDSSATASPAESARPDPLAAAALWPRFGLLTLGEIYWHQTGHELTLTLSETPLGPLEVWEAGSSAPVALVDPEPDGSGRVFKYVPPADPALDRLGETASKTVAFSARLRGGDGISLTVKMHRSRTARKDYPKGLALFGSMIALGALWSAAGRRRSRPWP